MGGGWWVWVIKGAKGPLQAAFWLLLQQHSKQRTNVDTGASGWRWVVTITQRGGGGGGGDLAVEIISYATTKRTPRTQSPGVSTRKPPPPPPPKRGSDGSTRVVPTTVAEVSVWRSRWRGARLTQHTLLHTGVAQRVASGSSRCACARQRPRRRPGSCSGHPSRRPQQCGLARRWRCSPCACWDSREEEEEEEETWGETRRQH